MAYASSQPVKEVPGFARVGQAIRKGVLAVLDPIFGTPENPTKLGKAMNLVGEASQYGLMAGPATGMMRYAVRAPLTVDPRFLGSGTVPLPNVQRSVSKAFVPRSGFSSLARDAQAVREGLTEGKKALVPKSMFSNAPGDFAYLDDVGNVVIPDSTASLIRRYSDRYVRVAPPGAKTPRAVSMTEVEKMAKNVDKANAPYDLKQANLRALSDAVNPYWQYWMYERDIASLNKTLAAYRAPKDKVTRMPVFYKNQENLSFDVLSAEAAQTVLSNLPGTRYRLGTPGLGAVDYMPNHVSAMSRDRFVKPGSTLFDLYNDGYLPYQSATFLGAERKVDGRTVRPIMRVTDHHEFLDVPDGFMLSRVANRNFPRVYHAGREVPSYKFTPVDPGDIEAVYRLDGKSVVPSTGRYTASIGLQQASKGGDSPHKNFRNFLASDKVPESIFGYRVVQRSEDYTPEDVEFFRANPKAAGFYDLGDEAMDEGTPQQAAKSKPTRGKYPGLTNNPGNIEKHELRTDKTLFEGEDAGGRRPKRFARFTDPILGLKAAATVMARHADSLAKKGRPFTIENYAPLYAPPGENDTEAYIRNLSAYSGIPRNMDIDRWDTEHLAKLLKAKVRFETSPEASNWFTDEEYETAADKLQEGVFD